MNTGFVSALQAGLDDLKAAGTYKRLNHLASPQAARVQMEGRGEVLILSSNNYLGLATHPKLIDAMVKATQEFGVGSGADLMARVLAVPMSETLGQTVVIENVPGAASSKAAGMVAAAEPDGYTIFLGPAGATKTP